MQLGAKIKTLRTKRQLSQEAVANELNVSRQAVAKWESDVSLPSTANLMALCNLFGVSLSELTEPQTLDAMPQKRGRGHRRLAAVTVLFVMFSAAALFWQQKNALPDNVIGYADAATNIWVSGTPIYLYLLYGITVLLVLFTAVLFIKVKTRQKGKQK